MKKKATWTIACLLLIFGTGAWGQSTAVLAEFSDPDDPRVGSKVTLTGPATPPLNERVEYVLQLEATEPPQRGYRSGYVLNGVATFLVPQTSLACGGGMYVYFDSIQTEVFDPRTECWLALDEEKNADIEYLKTVPLRALPFGVGVLASYLIDRRKDPADQFLLSKEEYRNYYKEAKQLWSDKYPKLRIRLPVELRGPLTEQEKFGLQLYYEEGSASYYGSHDIFDNHNRQARTKRASREVVIDDLLAALARQ